MTKGAIVVCPSLKQMSWLNEILAHGRDVQGL